MNLIDFVKKYNGVKVDFDGAYGAQCVDLFRQYCTDVLLIPQHTGSVEGAKDLFLRYDTLPIEQKYFVALSKAELEYFPLLAGDVLIFGETKVNKYGHVAILLQQYSDNLLVFEQNGLKQDGAKLAFRSFDNLIGVLRHKKTKTL